MFNQVSNFLLALAYPQACHICERSVEDFSDGIACRKCWKKTRIFCGKETLCDKCGAFLSESEKPVKTFCHRCDLDYYDAARAAGIYEKALAASVIQLKNEPHAAKTLRNLFISAFYNADFHDANLIIPVPLSKQRFLERGHNQAGVLADVLKKETKIKTDHKSLARKIHTPAHRAAMDEKARELSVKNAFEAARPEFIKNQIVLLVDDVFTSGATVSACAKVLKKAGASKVYVLTVARAN
ncbi:MAG: putative amidophosphoribosyltransferase [Acidobacteria bacterium]|jgi:competence protein ComFC|nr:putative amidophosphoribosyltransferase [Acidobacteriota bacterium]